MLQRWSWLNLDEALCHKAERERVLYRHFVPIYLHYQGEYLRAQWEGDAALSADKAQVVRAVVQAFVDTLRQHELALDEVVLGRYDIEIDRSQREPALEDHQSYGAAFAIFEDCLSGRDPQQELAAAEQGWVQHLQQRALDVGRRWFGG